MPISNLPIATVVPKYSINKSKKTSVEKHAIGSKKSKKVKRNSDLDMTETHDGINDVTKSCLKKSNKTDRKKLIMPDNFEKTKKSNDKSLNNKHAPKNLTKECLMNGNVNNDSTNCSLRKDKSLNRKKRKLNTCQIPQTLEKLPKIETDCKIKRMKKSKITLKSNQNFPSTDDSDEDEAIRNELQNTPMFKKLQKLMKLSPHLNPNFTEDAETDNSSYEEISDEDWPSEIDEDLTDSEAEVSNEDQKNSPEGSSESETDDLPHKKASYLSKSDSSQVKNKHISSLINSQSNDDKMKLLNSQTSQLVNSKSQLSNNLISQSINRNPLKLKANENVKRPSTIMEKARAKLAAAKFRFLNEKLYTESGGEAFTYFQENREEFEDYHLGYEMQVSKWPLNPVDVIISDLQKSKKDVVIADMGCGDAKIARVLVNKKVHSFDLVAMHDCVTACNISRVPLPDSNVDAVVFCLSLMGVNLVDYLQEAYRILKLGGSLKIAEVESRIENLDLFIKSLNALGFALERKNTKNKLFVFLDLKKVKKGKASKTPTITLRPCLYKKR